jgi:sn-glycerol 3-phosphate transport system substrate-binding protein
LSSNRTNHQLGGVALLFKRLTLLLLVTVVAASLFGSASRTNAQKPVEITFYWSSAVAGDLPKIFQGYADTFNKANADVKVNLVYGGGYADTLKKIQTEVSGGGTSADVAILLTTDVYTLADNDYIVPLDDFIKNTKDGDTYIKDFFPAFMRNSVAYGQVYGIPFQRSTPVLYFNKDMFKAAGLDPAAPKTWQDMQAAAKKLTKSDGSVWGIEIPSDGFPYWLFQGFAISNGQNVVGDASNKVFFNTPSTVEALQFVSDLANKDNVMPKGVIKWGDTPTDFVSGKVAMIYHTTGSLTNILSKAKFDVGVGFLPAGKKGYGAPTGGGNLYILKSAPADHQQAAWKWMQFLSSPEIQADWTVQTGYIAARQAAWETKTLKDLVAAKPQYGVARDQLQYSDKELTSHQGADVQKILGKAIQAAITGEKTPQQALDEAQKSAETLLKDYPDEAVVATPAATATH